MRHTDPSRAQNIAQRVAATRDHAVRRYMKPRGLRAL